MTERVLVAYASRTGVTKEIAEVIGSSLGDEGLETTVCEAISASEVADYDMVIIGSPIYGGALRDEVLTFVESHQMELMDKRVAMFTVGMLPVYDSAGARGEHEGAVEMARLRAPGVNPVSHVVFKGAYDPEKVDFVSRKLMDHKNAPVGDFRDWDAIRSWANSLKETLAA